MTNESHDPPIAGNRSARIDEIGGKLTGVFAPIVTPFCEDESIDDSALAFNLQKCQGSGLRGFLVLGSNGENKSLTEAEKLDVLRAVGAYKQQDQVVIAGVMYETQRQAEWFLGEAARIGADFGLVQSPYYFKRALTDEVLYRFFSDLADVSPIPLLLYNIPSVTGIELSYELLGRLSKHPNIAGLKDSSSENIYQNLKLSGDHFRVLAGSISQLFPAGLDGAVGGTVSLANYLPEAAVALWRCVTSRDQDQGRPLHDRLTLLNKRVSGHFGVAGVKAAMNLLGFQGGIPRRPLTPLTIQQNDDLRAAFIEQGLFYHE